MKRLKDLVSSIATWCSAKLISYREPLRWHLHRRSFEYMIKNRLGRRWDRLSRAGIKELLKGEWELSIKPQFKPTNSSKEYLVSVPAEAFNKEKKLTDIIIGLKG